MGAQQDAQRTGRLAVQDAPGDELPQCRRLADAPCSLPKFTGAHTSGPTPSQTGQTASNRTANARTSRSRLHAPSAKQDAAGRTLQSTEHSSRGVLLEPMQSENGKAR